MKLGLSSYTFGWGVGVQGFPPAEPLTVPALLATAQAWGVAAVQIADNMPLDGLRLDELQEIAAFARQLGLTVEVGMRGLTCERLERYLRVAQVLDATILRAVIDDVQYEPSIDAVVGILQDAVGLLGQTCLAIENHDRFQAASLRRIIEAVASDNVAACLDTANSLGAGEGLETVLRELGPYTVNLHIKDFRISRIPSMMGFAVEGRPAGGGCLDIPSLLHSIGQYQRCNSAILELWTPAEESLSATIAKERAWAQQSIQYLHSFFA